MIIKQTSDIFIPKFKNIQYMRIISSYSYYNESENKIPILFLISFFYYVLINSLFRFYKSFENKLLLFNNYSKSIIFLP